jgi:hypothetical protein
MSPANTNMDAVIQRLQDTAATSQLLRWSDFTRYNGASGERSLLMEYEAELPIVFREDGMRLVFVVVEEFTTDGSGNEQTFGLSNNLIETVNTEDLVLFSDGSRARPNSIDYGANEFKYTDGGAAETLDAFYIVRDPVQIEIVKKAPRSQGNVEEVLYDEVTSLLHTRDQNQEPPAMDFAGDHPLTPVVPRKWSVQLYANGSVAFANDDSDTGTDNGVQAVNALLKIPINRAQEDVEGLTAAVRQAITMGPRSQSV